MSGRLLTLEEAARLLGCSTRTLRRRAAAGALPVFRDGRLVRIPEGALAGYVAARTSRARPIAPPPSVSPPRRRPAPAARSLFDLPDPLDTGAKLINDQPSDTKTPRRRVSRPGAGTRR